MPKGERINTFSRYEVARGRENLSLLFARGYRHKGNALMLITASVASQVAGRGASVRVLVTVGKKLVPKAVERNRIKRLMREAYRLEKSALADLKAGMATAREAEVIFLAFMYRGRRGEVPSLQEFRVEMNRMLQAFVKRRMRTTMNDDHEHGG